MTPASLADQLGALALAAMSAGCGWYVCDLIASVAKDVRGARPVVFEVTRKDAARLVRDAISTPPPYTEVEREYLSAALALLEQRRPAAELAEEALALRAAREAMEQRIRNRR